MQDPVLSRDRDLAKVLVLVPARGGSKGIPGKNLSQLGNASLLEWAVTIGLSIPDSMGVMVSTDYDDIAAEGERAGATILRRPSKISQDTSTVVDMVHYHLDELEARGQLPETIVYLEPTSPFRTRDEILTCIDRMHDGKLDSVATFQALSFHPSWLVKLDEAGRARRLMPGRQAWSGADVSDAVFALTGAVYVFRVDAFRKENPSGIFFGKTGHIVQSSPAVDIDTPFDLETARGILQYYQHPFLEEIGLID